MTSCTKLTQLILPAGREVCHTTSAPDFSNGLAEQKELTGDVNANHRVPLFERHVDERCVLLQSGIVDLSAVGADCLSIALNASTTLAFPGHVGFTRKGVSAGPFISTTTFSAASRPPTQLTTTLGAGLTESNVDRP